MSLINKRSVILMIVYILEHYSELKDKNILDIYEQSYKYISAYIRKGKFKQPYDDVIKKYQCDEFANNYQEYMDTEDLSGMKFGKLTVISRASDKTDGNKRIPMWNCICDCGNTYTGNGYLIQSGKTTSCGCVRSETSRDRMKKYNKFDLSGDFGIGYTTKGEEFYFDKEDFEKIKDICWNIDAYGYVAAGGRKSKMHRLVMGVTNSKQSVDHINHLRNDNRKCNLRICTHSENMKNIKPERNKYGVVGISWSKRDEKWIVQISCDNVPHYIGSFEKFDDAVEARRIAEDEYFGEYAYKNSNVSFPAQKEV